MLAACVGHAANKRPRVDRCQMRAARPAASARSLRHILSRCTRSVLRARGPIRETALTGRGESGKPVSAKPSPHARFQHCSRKISEELRSRRKSRQNAWAQKLRDARDSAGHHRFLAKWRPSAATFLRLSSAMALGWVGRRHGGLTVSHSLRCSSLRSGGPAAPSGLNAGREGSADRRGDAWTRLTAALVGFPEPSCGIGLSF